MFREVIHKMRGVDELLEMNVTHFLKHLGQLSLVFTKTLSRTKRAFACVRAFEDLARAVGSTPGTVVNMFLDMAQKLIDGTAFTYQVDEIPEVDEERILQHQILAKELVRLIRKNGVVFASDLVVWLPEAGVLLRTVDGVMQFEEDPVLEGDYWRLTIEDLLRWQKRLATFTQLTLSSRSSEHVSDALRLVNILQDSEQWFAQSGDDPEDIVTRALGVVTWLEDHWRDFASGKRMRELCALVSFGVMVPVVKRLGLEPDDSYLLSLFKNFYRDSEVKCGADFFSRSVKFSFWLLKATLTAIQDKNLKVFGYDDRESYEVMRDLINLTVTGENILATGYSFIAYDEAVCAVLDRAVRLEKQVTREHRVVFSQARFQLMKVQKKVRIQAVAYSDRRMPFSTLITGNSGIGKSSLVQMVRQTFFEVYMQDDDLRRKFEEQNGIPLGTLNPKRARLPPNMTWNGITFVPMKDSEYFDGYHGQLYCLLDDIAAENHKHPEFGKDLARLLDLVNDVPHITNQSAVENKGMVPFRSECIIATSNTKHLNAHVRFEFPAAVLRRFPYVIIPKVKPDYAGKGNMLREPEIGEGRFTDAWLFRVEFVSPMIGNPQKVNYTKVIDGVSIDELREWFVEQVRKWDRNSKDPVCDIVFDTCECGCCLPPSRCPNRDDVIIPQADVNREELEEDGYETDLGIDDILEGLALSLAQDIERQPLKTKVDVEFCVDDEVLSVCGSHNRVYYKESDMPKCPIRVRARGIDLVNFVDAPLTKTSQMTLLRKLQIEGMNPWNGLGLREIALRLHSCRIEEEEVLIKKEPFDWVLLWETVAHFFLGLFAGMVSSACFLTVMLNWLCLNIRKIKWDSLVSGLVAEAVLAKFKSWFDKVMAFLRKRIRLIAAIAVTAAIVGLVGYLTMAYFDREDDPVPSPDDSGVWREPLHAEADTHKDVWVKDDDLPTMWSQQSQTARYGDVLKHAAGNTVRFKTACLCSDCEKDPRGHSTSNFGAFATHEHFFVTNRHSFTCSGPWQLAMQVSGAQMPIIEIVPGDLKISDVNDDACMFRYVHGRVRKDVRRYFCPEERPRFRPMDVALVFRHPKTFHVDVYEGGGVGTRGEGCDDVSLGTLQSVYQYGGIDTKDGWCGSPLLGTIEGRRPVLLGIHVGTNNAGGCIALQITQPEIERLVRQFKLKFSTSVNVAQTLKSYGVTLEPLHANSKVQWSGNKMRNHDVVGSLRKRTHPKSRVRRYVMDPDDPWFEHVESELGDVPFGAPVMKAFQRDGEWFDPYVHAFNELENPMVVSETKVQEAADAYLRDVLPFVGAARPLTLDESINGTAHPFVNSVPFRTSAGFPHSGPKGRLMESVEIGPDGSVLKRKLGSELQLDYERKLSLYLQGERAGAIYQAHLKDEPRKQSKIDTAKTRVFSGGQYTHQLLLRQLLLPVVANLMKHPTRWECAIGVNPMSKQWEQLHEYLKGHSDNLFAGDYKAFDKSIPAVLLASSFYVLIEAAAASYQTFTVNGMELTVDEFRDLCWIVVSDVINPITIFNGDVIILTCSNPSGQAFTAVSNSIANSVLQRMCYAFLYVSLDDFRDFVHPINLGDDNTVSVSEERKRFNHTAFANYLGDRQMTYTMADKESASVPFISMEEADFLKRKWKTHPYKGVDRVFAPLDPQSIRKQLVLAVESKEVNQEFQLSQSIFAALLEMVHHGPEEYQRFQTFILDMLERYPKVKFYTDHGPSLTLSWDEMVEKYWDFGEIRAQSENGFETDGSEFTELRMDRVRELGGELIEARIDAVDQSLADVMNQIVEEQISLEDLRIVYPMWFGAYRSFELVGYADFGVREFAVIRARHQDGTFATFRCLMDEENHFTLLTWTRMADIRRQNALWRDTYRVRQHPRRSVRRSH